MEILSYKSGGHDASVVSVRDGRLIFSVEGEKDSRMRRALFAPGEFERIVDRWQCRPDVLCGDSTHFGSYRYPDNYFGLKRSDILYGDDNRDARHPNYWSVPHELAHIACSFALSDLPERNPFYALVWEGYIGRFYRVDENFSVAKLGTDDHVMSFVGLRYTLPYHAVGLDEPIGHTAAGKIMALAGLVDRRQPLSHLNQKLVALALNSSIEYKAKRISLNADSNAAYEAFAPYREVPVTDPEFVALCAALQDGVFERFRRFAEDYVTERLPLLISGGCGLNCHWNTMWRKCGLFESVFVPPVPNDSGIGIGTAAVVHHMQTGKMKLDWNVYAGEEFVSDQVDFAAAGFVEMELNCNVLADWMLNHDIVIAWIQGRYEIGPRSLCHRSLIASPFKRRTQDEINRIKERETFRPVAPVCLEEDVAKHFDWRGPSPYMLYFQTVTSQQLKAITHADGTARVQTVNQNQDPATYKLLKAFREQSGFGVLCNTSLNFRGRGFINRASDLVRYVLARSIPAFVINDRMYVSMTFPGRTTG